MKLLVERLQLLENVLNLLLEVLVLVIFEPQIRSALTFCKQKEKSERERGRVRERERETESQKHEKCILISAREREKKSSAP